MRRYLCSEIEKMIERKIIILTGPRQVGKTTLAKSLNSSIEYLNYDRNSHRTKIIKEEWDHSQKILVLDELHKMKKWKLWLKGLYDTDLDQKMIVTGSAKLDTHRKVGDSLAGRYFQYQLFPLDLKELKQQFPKSSTFDNFTALLNLSGFPEPYFSGSTSYYKKWRRTHLDVILKQDLIETESVKRINDLLTLVELSTERVGSVFSHKSMSEDLQTDDKTIKRWMRILENSYILFNITPYSKNLKSTLRKASKYYFYDYPRIENKAARLENFVALSLLKEVYYRNEVLGEEYKLHYMRDNNQNEIDFLIVKEKIPIILIEVKTSDANVSKAFATFSKYLFQQNPRLQKVQLVSDLKTEYMNKDKVQVCKLASWLEKMEF